MRKVCSGFRANLYDCPYSINEREDLIEKIQTRLQDLEQVMQKYIFLM